MELLLLGLVFWNPHIVKKKAYYEPLKVNFFIDTTFSQKGTAASVKKELLTFAADAIEARYFSFDQKVKPLSPKALTQLITLLGIPWLLL